MENPEVAQIFDEVADLLDIQGENPFRIRAYRNAARTVRDLGERLADMPREKLVKLGGIGQDLAGKIGTILDTCDLPLRKELRAKVPAGLRDLITLQGLGPKRAQLLYKRLKITSLDDLRQAVEKHRLQRLRGFGAVMEEKIQKALLGRDGAGKRVLLAEAKVFADAVVQHLKQTPGVGRVEVAGSFRRRRETVGDLDLLMT